MVTPLNAPREIRVAAAGDGHPASVRAGGGPVSARGGGRQRRVARISNEWRIDDEWWRQELSRHYFEMEIEDGQVITVFCDLVSGKWYQQRY
jgi:hypothetical protein